MNKLENTALSVPEKIIITMCDGLPLTKLKLTVRLFFDIILLVSIELGEFRSTEM